MDFTPSWSGQGTSPPRVLQTAAAANMCFHFYFTRHVAYMLLMRGWPWNEQGLVNYYYSPWHRTSSAKTTQDRNHTDSGQMGAFFITSANQQLLLLLYLARYTTTFLLFFYLISMYTAFVPVDYYLLMCQFRVHHQTTTTFYFFLCKCVPCQQITTTTTIIVFGTTCKNVCFHWSCTARKW